MDARRVVRKWLAPGGGEACGGKQILVKLINPHAPQRPWLMFHRHGHHPACDLGERSPASGQEVVPLHKLFDS
jgi:hypothetical protein